ncbi:subtilase family protein [Mycobacterium xenopi 4042]|uniref:Subtilase family protein n=1 Tax=Mycobacterium xenopi 4042 TaxID=1299334 RepID=X8BHG5_MYCXE|nr:subtilase family protein [Mycobacterium xenopi 4042]
MHAANMGASVINISDVTCMSVRNVLDQADLGAAVRYAAVDKDAVIVTAAGDTSKKDCKQNPVFDPLQPNDPRDWNGVNTVVTPSWFSDYVLAVGAVDSSGAPMANMSVAGPWVSIAAPGTDIVGLSPRDNGLVNAVEGRRIRCWYRRAPAFRRRSCPGWRHWFAPNIRSCRRIR